MSHLELIKRWYSDCKEYYGEGFRFEPIDGPRMGHVSSGVVDPARLAITRDNYLKNR